MMLGQIAEIDEAMRELRGTGGGAMPDVLGMQTGRYQRDVESLELAVAQQKNALRASGPQHQAFLALMEREDQLEELITTTEENKLKFETVAGTLKPPIEVNQRASDPVSPVRPNRVLNIALFTVLGLAAGLGLVMGRESMDRSVKLPEHVATGLTLPLLAVVPRLRRLARMTRGGHVWTPGWPESPEADAYRNLRASLLGHEPADRPHATILITSAKAGEGKSTTALNLAATYARSGERTILVDCDLRRPSLAPVFGVDPEIGLVDVLRGEVPWQRAVAACDDVPILSFLPAGHLGGVPIEILGSLELQQLVSALARNYHRVILDGPAILGLADARMLGRLADTTVLVVRAGAHELSPLRRAKAMLDQSRVEVGGVVFNALSDDLENWSSYGHDAPALVAPVDPRRKGIEARPREAVV
jgi:capsular exopolysaccharide synthesis family protein